MNQDLKSNEQEVNLGDLFRLLKQIFKSIGSVFINFVSFVLKHAIVLIILVVIGTIAGYFLQNISDKLVKTEMIVAADFNSAEYLYKSIDELQYKIKKEDEEILKALKINDTLTNLSFEITPLININEFTNEQEKYYEALNESNFLGDEEKEGMIKRFSNFYRIKLIHPEKLDSRLVLNQVLEIIRDNDYYKKVYTLNSKKIDFLINSNEFLISQIDSLVKNYSKENKNQPLPTSSVNYSNTTLDLGIMIGNRSNLLEELDKLYANKVASEELFTLVDLGYPAEIEDKRLTSYKLILTPLLLVLAYFAFIIFSKVIIKARKLNK